jgi:hypothetical protein
LIFWCPNTCGINAFKQIWTKLISKMYRDRCECTLIVPIWKSSNYWPLIFPNEKDYTSFIKDSFHFKPRVLTRRGRDRNVFFLCEAFKIWFDCIKNRNRCLILFYFSGLKIEETIMDNINEAGVSPEGFGD